MSRAIKFRVWDPQTNKMFFSSKCPFGSSWITEDGVSIAHGIDTLSVEMLSRAGPEHMLSPGWQDRVEQFTGLFDSKRVEIYEGDIIKSDYYNRAAGVIEYNGKAAVWQVRGHAGGLLSCYGMGESPYNVVGNIHQNPELLNP